MGFVWIEDKDDDQKFKDHLEEKIKEATESLSNSNEGLKSDITKLKKKVKDKEGIDVDEYNSLKAENKTLKEKRENEETDAQKALRLAKEQLETDNEDLKKRIGLLENESKESLVDTQVMKALIKAKVKDTMMKAATKIITADVTIVEEGMKRIAKIGDKTINEYVEWWAGTDEGKNFILAEKNKGGGGGGNDHNTTESEWAKYFDVKGGTVNYTKQVMLKNQDRALYDKLQKQYAQ